MDRSGYSLAVYLLLVACLLVSASSSAPDESDRALTFCEVGRADHAGKIPWTEAAILDLRGDIKPPFSKPIGIVIASAHEYDHEVYKWLSWLGTSGNNKRYQPFIYQRSWPDKPRYSVPWGREATVYIQYVYENYDHLPDHTLFIHAHPHQEKDWFCWMDCLRPNASYISISSPIIRNRSAFSAWGHLRYGPYVEQCWRDFAKLSGAPFAPKTDPTISAPCCGHFLASREHLRRRPFSYWEALHLKISGGKGGICHDGPLDVDELFHPRAAEIGPEKDVIEGGRHTIAGAFEHLAHMMFGTQGHQGVIPGQAEYCAQFLPSSICPGSLCRS